MFNRLFLIFTFCFVFGEEDNTLFIVGEDSVFTSFFYSQVPRSDWESFSFEKKESVFNDFLKTELVYYNSIKTGFIYNPVVSSKLLNRKKLLLINNYYEHFIARPFINKGDIEETSKNLALKKHTYHLLVSFVGGDGSSSQKSKEMAFLEIQSLKKELNLITDSTALVDEFINYAKLFSDDPSAKQNGGDLGWLTWGLVVDSFQKPVFNLKELVVSDIIETPFGFHLALVSKTDYSDYHYYPKKDYQDLLYKVAMRNLDFNFLSSYSKEQDSLLIKKASLSLNSVVLDSVFAEYLLKKESDRLFGNRGSFINWLDKNQKFQNSILLSYENKGFGVGWLINRISFLPASRIPSFKDLGSLESFLTSLVLEDLVLISSKKNNIEETFSFKKDFLNNSKNIIYNEYISSLLNKIEIDSSVVRLAYNNGVYNKSKDFILPKRVLLSEMKFMSEKQAQEIKQTLDVCFNCFDSLLVVYKGEQREPISSGGGGAVGSLAFSLSPGSFGVVENSRGSFSVFRVDSFLDPTPFKLKNVYSQVERKLIKEKQTLLKNSILDSMIHSLQPFLFKENIGL